ncbi:MAG TPA: CPBP family intramembrane glutamic endopeptidase [Polyangiaceae bacterium]|nr:CPBP family intramembrane glutamic endopeptidase [Polyangiaceae bacterium]
MPAARHLPPWVFAVSTVIWAMFVGLLLRILLALIAPLLGPRVVNWLEHAPLGLVVGAVLIQLSLFFTAWARSTLVPWLRDDLILGMATRQARPLSAVLLTLGLAPLANWCGMLAANASGGDLEAIELVARLVKNASWFEFSLMAITLTLLPALVEEGIFRGLVLRSLETIHPALAICGSAVAFGAFHMDIAQGVATSLLGLGFGFIMYTTRSLLGSMVAHGVYNLVVLTSQRYLPAADSPTEPEWVELGLGLALALVAALWLWQRRVPTTNLRERATT